MEHVSSSFIKTTLPFTVFEVMTWKYSAFILLPGTCKALKMDGMEKVLMGLTDLKMVRFVCIK